MLTTLRFALFGEGSEGGTTVIVFLVRPVKFLGRESQKQTVMIDETWSAIRRLSTILHIVSDLPRVTRGAGLRPAAWKRHHNPDSRTCTRG